MALNNVRPPRYETILSALKCEEFPLKHKKWSMKSFLKIVSVKRKTISPS